MAHSDLVNKMCLRVNPSQAMDTKRTNMVLLFLHFPSLSTTSCCVRHQFRLKSFVFLNRWSFKRFFSLKAIQSCKTCLEAKWNAVWLGTCMWGFIAHCRNVLAPLPKRATVPYCGVSVWSTVCQLWFKRPVTAGFTVLGWWLAVVTQELGWDPQ